MAKLIHKKCPTLEDIEARDLKFSIGPYNTYTHAVQKLVQPNVYVFMKSFIICVALGLVDVSQKYVLIRSY